MVSLFRVGIMAPNENLFQKKEEAMLTKDDEAFIDRLAEENRHQREVIHKLIRERIETEKYWKEFVLKLIEKGIVA